MNNNFFLSDHPLVKRDMTILRDKNTGTEYFRSAVKRISNILAVEIAKSFNLKKADIETPLEKPQVIKLIRKLCLFLFFGQALEW
jgi:uracil phosphoribosyltransferase